MGEERDLRVLSGFLFLALKVFWKQREVNDNDIITPNGRLRAILGWEVILDYPEVLARLP